MTNYPDGTYDADPRAPWNQPAAWETETCGTCRWNREADIYGVRTQACCHPDAAVVVMPAPTHACDCWERR